MDPTGRQRTSEYVARLDRSRETLAEEVEPDVEAVRHLTLDQRGDWVARACASAWMILQSRPDRTEVLSRREPPAADFDDKWRALRARFQRQREEST
jgi:hypothetical protein